MMRLWKLVVDQIETMAIRLCHTVELNDETALETLLLADDLGVNYMNLPVCTMYRMIKTFHSILAKENQNSILWNNYPSDVFNVVKPMGNVTVNKSIAKTKVS